MYLRSDAIEFLFSARLLEAGRQGAEANQTTAVVELNSKPCRGFVVVSRLMLSKIMPQRDSC